MKDQELPKVDRDGFLILSDEMKSLERELLPAAQRLYRHACKTEQLNVSSPNTLSYTAIAALLEARTQIGDLQKTINELAGGAAQGLLIHGRRMKAEDDLAALRELVNSPETEDFFKGIELETAHQRVRWPAEQDARKTHPDWFWLIGYLAGKCLHAAIAGDREKALHHTISTAAALANWHRAIKGGGNMPPRIATPAEGIPDAAG